MYCFSLNLISTAPPTAVRNLILVSSTDTGLVVSWEAPEEPGRTDYYYTVSRSVPSSLGAFKTVEDHLINGQATVTFSLTNLIPFTDYIIRVSVHNGVSQSDCLRIQEIATRTVEGSECNDAVRMLNEF